MTKILVIANQAGSAGKTTTTVALAGELAKRGRQVVVIDADGQANASHHLGVAEPKHTTGDVLVERCELGDAVIETGTPGLWLLPSSPELDQDVAQLMRRPVGAEQRMRMALEPLRATGEADYILIDCPGALGIITISAMVAAAGDKPDDPANVITVVAPQAKEVEGLPRIEETIDDVRNAYNRQLALGAIVLCMVPPLGAGLLYGQVADQLREAYGDLVGPPVRRSVRVPEAYAHGRLIQDHAPGDAITLDYANVTDWMLSRGVL